MNTIKFIFLLGLLILQTIASATSLPGPSGIFIFPDRSWAISGDTVWFAVSNLSTSEKVGNVVHVQLENLSGAAVSRVMVVTAEGRGEGYLPVPDSLSSGFYWLKAWSGEMIHSPEAVVWGNLLPVYNRFAEELTAFPSPAEMKSLPALGLDGIQIKVNPEEVTVRGEVSVTLMLPENAGQLIREMVISAGVVNPGAEPTDLYYPLIPETTGSVGEEESVEQDGFFIRGRIVPAAGLPLPERALVLLSIPGALPWLDYCLTDQKGNFRFRLHKAWGTAQVYLRVLGPGGEDLKVELTDDRIRTGSGTESLLRLPDTSSQKFVKEMLEAEYFKRLFTPEKPVNETAFTMKWATEVPFYGLPDHHVIPSDFIQLPDFSEICRELLPTARFRKADGQYSLRMLDELERKYFEKSPLRLINGVPVFSDQLLYRLKSSDIRSIDLIDQERVFGDLSFKGVMAITLNDQAGNWLSEEKNLYKFTVPCLQIPLPSGEKSHSGPPVSNHIPDLRRVFLFQKIGTSSMQTFHFNISDLKGTVLIKIAGITTGNLPFSVTRKILVK